MKKQEIIQEIAKSSPPITVGALTIFGIQLSDIVLILTALYTTLQIYFLVRDKLWNKRKIKKQEEKDGDSE